VLRLVPEKQYAKKTVMGDMSFRPSKGGEGSGKELMVREKFCLYSGEINLTKRDQREKNWTGSVKM